MYLVLQLVQLTKLYNLTAAGHNLTLLSQFSVNGSASNSFEYAIRSLGIKANEHYQENYDLKIPTSSPAHLFAIRKSRKSCSGDQVEKIQLRLLLRNLCSTQV